MLAGEARTGGTREKSRGRSRVGGSCARGVAYCNSEGKASRGKWKVVGGSEGSEGKIGVKK